MNFKRFLLENSSSMIGGIPYYLEDGKIFFLVIVPSNNRPESINNPQIALQNSSKITPDELFIVVRELLGIERKNVEEFYKVFPNYSALGSEETVSVEDNKSHVYALRVDKGVAIRKTEPEVLRVIWLNEMILENFRKDQVEMLKEILKRIKKHHGIKG